MIINLTPFFDLFFYSIIFLVSLDYIISGFIFLRRSEEHIKKPKLLGLWIIQKMGILDGSTNHSKLVLIMFSRRSMAIQALIAGLMLSFSSFLMIVEAATSLF